MKYLDNITEKDIGKEFILDPTQTCTSYKDEFDTRKKCRDAVIGSKAIKGAGTVYLPRPNGQDSNEYESYKQRAIWTNFTARTVEAYIGMMYRKDPIRDYKIRGKIDEKAKAKYDSFFKVVTFDGLTSEQFSNTITEEIITTNKVGVLLDYIDILDENGDPIINSKLDVEKHGVKPLFSIYTFETILNWWTIYENTRPIPTLFVLKELADSYSGSSLLAEKEERYRILYLENFKDPNNRVYKQIVVGKINSEQKREKVWGIKDVIVPLKNGRPLNYIPFYVLTDQGIQYVTPSEPLINDLADVNIGHYINSADLENSLHWTGTKTAIFPGWDKELNGDPVLGKAMSVPAGEANRPFILEAKSDNGISEEMQKKEQRMAILGAEKIAQTGRYIASATTAQISSISESSVLSDMSTSLSEALSRLFTLQLEWYGESDIEIIYTLVTDYYADTLTGAELVQYVESMQKGGISPQVLFYNLRKKEAYPEGWTYDDEQQAIKEATSLLFREERTVTSLADIEKARQERKNVPVSITGKDEGAVRE